MTLDGHPADDLPGAVIDQWKNEAHKVVPHLVLDYHCAADCPADAHIVFGGEEGKIMARVPWWRSVDDNAVREVDADYVAFPVR